jgi:ParB/RepB/Spo0J family partition protein
MARITKAEQIRIAAQAERDAAAAFAHCGSTRDAAGIYTVSIPTHIELNNPAYFEMKGQLLKAGFTAVPRHPRSFTTTKDPAPILQGLAGTTAAQAPETSAPVPVTFELQGGRPGRRRSEETEIHVGDIVPDPNQPRKDITEQEVAELADSIRKVGLIHNITVRRTQGPAGDDHFFMLISGERRWMACQKAGIEVIRALIIDATDEEVEEIQLVENLHRADVHPLMEANYFKRMLERVPGRTHFDIAAMITKSENYVRSRLKLTHLIQPWQDLYRDSGITLSEALAISAASEETQSEFYETLGLEAREPGTTVNLSNMSWYLKARENDLTRAPFDTTDPTLNPEKGPCTTCVYNTAVKELFGALGDEKPMCTLPGCFRMKSMEAFFRKIDEHVETGGVCVIPQEYLSEDEKFWPEQAKARGVTILPHGAYVMVYGAPKSPGTYEQYVAGLAKLEPGDEGPTEQALADQYERAQIAYEEKFAEFVGGGKVSTWALCLAGRQRGNLVPIKLTEAFTDIITPGSSPEAQGDAPDRQDRPSAIDTALAAQILVMKERKERADVLDAERMWLEVTELANGKYTGHERIPGIDIGSPGGNPETDLPFNLTRTEIGALCAILWESLRFEFRHKEIQARICEYFDTTMEALGTIEGKREIFFDHQNGVLLTYLQRLFILGEGFSRSKSHLTGPVQPFTYEFVKERIPREITALELKYDGKAGKRARSLEARIAAAQRQFQGGIITKEPSSDAPGDDDQDEALDPVFTPDAIDALTGDDQNPGI